MMKKCCYKCEKIENPYLCNNCKSELKVTHNKIFQQYEIKYSQIENVLVFNGFFAHGDFSEKNPGIIYNVVVKNSRVVKINNVRFNNYKKMKIDECHFNIDMGENGIVDKPPRDLQI